MKTPETKTPTNPAPAVPTLEQLTQTIQADTSKTKALLQLLNQSTGDCFQTLARLAELHALRFMQQVFTDDSEAAELRASRWTRLSLRLTNHLLTQRRLEQLRQTSPSNQPMAAAYKEAADRVIRAALEQSKAFTGKPVDADPKKSQPIEAQQDKLVKLAQMIDQQMPKPGSAPIPPFLQPRQATS